jgi:uncharacterized protein (TIGR03083 family)
MPKDKTIDDTTTWKLIHRERAALADTLEGLSESQWAAKSLCDGWSVQVTAAHVLAGAEQTGSNFFKGMAANGFRFNTMMDRVARRTAIEGPDEIIARLRARTTTTNHPPAPIMTMLGEVVVHGADIRQPLGIASDVAPEATSACLSMYEKASFPVGAKKRIQGLKLVATDVGWTHGSGPEVSGPGEALLLAMTGRDGGLTDLSGDGLTQLRARMATG